MLLEQINERFEEPIQTIQVGDEVIGLIKLKGARGTIVCTLDLGDYQMPVPSIYESNGRIELYFLLPEYWETGKENEVFSWAVNRLIAIKNYLKADQWAISGHTFSLGKLPSGRLKEVGFSALLLMDPLVVDELKTPLYLMENPRYFKALCPIFKMEKDVKEARGMDKFIHRMMDKGMTEKLDEFREPIIKPRFLFWR